MCHKVMLQLPRQHHHHIHRWHHQHHHQQLHREHRSQQVHHRRTQHNHRHSTPIHRQAMPLPHNLCRLFLPRWCLMVDISDQCFKQVHHLTVVHALTVVHSLTYRRLPLVMLQMQLRLQPCKDRLLWPLVEEKIGLQEEKEGVLHFGNTPKVPFSAVNQQDMIHCEVERKRSSSKLHAALILKADNEVNIMTYVY